MKPPYPIDPEGDLENRLAEIAALLARVSNLLRRMAPAVSPKPAATDASLSSAVLDLLPVLRQIYVQPAALAVRSLVLALAGQDGEESQTDQAVELLRRVIETEIHTFRSEPGLPGWLWPDACEDTDCHEREDVVSERNSSVGAKNGRPAR